ncbi:MAG TPA: NnrS family protein [Sandaracinaceae bacterium LLY-WYZ-13_1]|nr:NnrS family protein [Sandaracinaceae bacterium LLY-WYZ-13_1]
MEEAIPLRAERHRPRGFALFAKGFRPFFLLAALHAVVLLPAWILVYAGVWSVSDYLLPTAWHAHEMVFGFTVAVVAGFLLTAASNWTRRTTATGGWLAALCLAWLAGRAAPWLSGVLPPTAIAVASLAFLPLLAFAVGRVIVAARSRRNYGLVLVLAALFGAQLVTHLGQLRGAVLWQVVGPRVGVDLVVLLILVIGGRIIPLFTRNATKAEGITHAPWADRLSLAAAAAVALADLARLWPAGLPIDALVGGASAVAAVASAWRMRRWGTRHAGREPLLWVLHGAYAFVPLGFALRAVAVFTPGLREATALHALTVGAIGGLTLGMMARVSLGHTGRMLRAPAAITVAFGLMFGAALVRVAGPLVGAGVGTPSIHLAGTAWALAFLLFLVRIGPSLFRPRPDGRPG